MYEKIKQLDEIDALLAPARNQGLKVVQCHGVFDLLHPGHIRHLNEARKQGDKLVVSVTADPHVNKGPGRPIFPEKLRLEQLAALSCVDFVVLSPNPDALPAIRAIKPAIYSKGVEYQDHDQDITGKIAQETAAVEACGGRVHYTNDVVFSSSSLLNRFVDGDALRLAPFLKKLQAKHSGEEILEKIESLSKLKVLVIGDAIIDEYQYVDLLGQSGKGVHMTAREIDKETFLGGSLIIARHVAQFAREVTLLTAIGQACPYRPLIDAAFEPNIVPEWVFLKERTTLTKRRFVQRDGEMLTKLFETYSSNEPLLDEAQTTHLIHYIQKRAAEFDLVLVCDFGNGFTNPALIHALSEVPTFLALNTQTNSGNRGYHVVNHYRRADLISLNEPEIRLATQDRYSRLTSLAHDLSLLLHCPLVSVTRGVEGVYLLTSGEEVTAPALTSYTVDRVGAGDAYFALLSLAAACGLPALLGAFLGSAAAAMDVQIVGNKEPIHKVGLCKYVTRLLK